jgi:2'-5' RNA ligase
MIRTFVAIHLTPELLGTLQQAQNALRGSPGGPSARFVQPDNIHLTLKFLGDVDETRLPAVCQAVAAVAQRYQPLELLLGALGCFPNARRPRVVWVAIDSSERRLEQIAAELDDGMHTLGFAREARPFTAHLTLARIKDRADPRQAAELGQCAAAFAPLQGAMTAAEVAVIKSELRPQGPLYTDLCRARLGAPRAC